MSLQPPSPSPPPPFKWSAQHPTSINHAVIAIYAPMIYTAPCIMLLMRAASITRAVGGGWALEIEFLGPVKWHRADRRVPFGAQKTQDFLGA
jgi:hypothetical protein